LIETQLKSSPFMLIKLDFGKGEDLPETITFTAITWKTSEKNLTFGERGRWYDFGCELPKGEDPPQILTFSEIQLDQLQRWWFELFKLI